MGYKVRFYSWLPILRFIESFGKSPPLWAFLIMIYAN
jgi:hypothetical protein